MPTIFVTLIFFFKIIIDNVTKKKDSIKYLNTINVNSVSSSYLNKKNQSKYHS